MTEPLTHTLTEANLTQLQALWFLGAFQVALVLKNLPMQETEE